jgi:V-type H+-transporting ATPase subunit a
MLSKLTANHGMAVASVFFPEPMDYVEFATPSDAAYHLIREIAANGRVELIDSHSGNIAYAKRYTENYIYCEEADRSLTFLEQRLSEVPDLLPPAPQYSELVERIRSADTELREKIRMAQDLEVQQEQARRKLSCLRYFIPLVDHSVGGEDTEGGGASGSSYEISLVAGAELIQSVVGLVPSARVPALFKTVYRLSRGNAIYHRGDALGDLTPYAIFLHSATLCVKVKAVCQSFYPDVYEFPGDATSLTETEAQLASQIEQQALVETQTRSVNRDFLAELGREYWAWRAFVTRERQIWAVLDYGDFERADGTAFYFGWIPRRFSEALEPIQGAAQQASGSPREIAVAVTPAEEHEDLVVPTFIEENEFSTGFQSLNDAYGIPNYDEVNGGAFYGMYPFLFAVMFGDIGHAFFYCLISVAVLIFDPVVKKRNIDLGEIGGAIFSMKWLLALASLCSLYCGFIYNEFFGLPLFMANSAYREGQSDSNVRRWEKVGDSVYPFGMDPEWFFKDNELIFLNSYKMKLSVVMGMCQMVFGMFLQLIKHFHRRDWLEILVVWLPEMLYLVPFFGYLVVIIIVKWGTKFPQGSDGVNLIQMLIGMILSMGSKDPSLELYSAQWGVQTGIVVIFILSIPMMLFIKPGIQCFKLRGTPDFNILEIFVMNLIHVIEFALGALSHTASYLRLWALSLAHSQLSKVLYEQLFMQLMNMGAPTAIRGFLMVVGFAGYAVLTVAILLGMEAFSALLHAIRLMWVEFSSKFYEGMGTAFSPLSSRSVMATVGIR